MIIIITILFYIIQMILLPKYRRKIFFKTNKTIFLPKKNTQVQVSLYNCQRTTYIILPAFIYLNPQYTQILISSLVNREVNVHFNIVKVYSDFPITLYIDCIRLNLLYSHTLQLRTYVCSFCKKFTFL